MKPKPTEKLIFNIINANLLIEYTKQYFMKMYL